MITRENYEIYFIDYLDGKLSPSLRAELKAFLLVNPDLEELIEDLKDIRLEPPTKTYPHKNLLKKIPEQECPDYYAIAYAENVLTAQEKQVLGRQFRSEEFQALAEEYSRLKLIPDKTIRYEQKQKLYRKHLSKRILFSTIAAAIVLLLTFGLLIFKTPTGENILLSVHTETPVPEPPVSLHSLKPEKLVSLLPPLPQKLNPVPSSEIRILSEALLPNEPIVTALKTENTVYREELIPLSPISSPEIMLTENARAWKSSSNNFQSKDIFRSFIQASKTLAQKIRKEDEEL